MSKEIQVEPDEADVTRLAIEQRDEARAERDKAYRERADLVAYLSANYPSQLAEAESDDGAWWLVFVATPSGQMSWHVHEDDLELFPHLLDRDETGVDWDGHTTEQKYGRLRELTRTVATGIYGPQRGATGGSE
jgi:hypothetical protein